jgi:hypothetical protein
MLTEEEREWLTSLDAADNAVLIPRAMAALASAFGDPVRIESKDAMRAAEVLRVCG